MFVIPVPGNQIALLVSTVMAGCGVGFFLADKIMVMALALSVKHLDGLVEQLTGLDTPNPAEILKEHTDGYV